MSNPLNEITSVTTGEGFWEGHYVRSKRRSSGNPSKILVQYAEDLMPGRGLDLGCANGDDAVWLATKGWDMVGVDVSKTVLSRAKDNAQNAGVADRVKFQQYDLSIGFPDGQFDLVTAFFLHSPINFERARVLQRAAAAVAPGGLLLIVAHASAAPWSWSQPETAFPTPEEALAELELNQTDWRIEFLGAPERLANGPGGQTATVCDNVLAVQRI